VCVATDQIASLHFLTDQLLGRGHNAVRASQHGGYCIDFPFVNYIPGSVAFKGKRWVERCAPSPLPTCGVNAESMKNRAQWGCMFKHLNHTMERCSLQRLAGPLSSGNSLIIDFFLLMT
jgi:hypothetical protein